MPVQSNLIILTSNSTNRAHVQIPFITEFLFIYSKLFVWFSRGDVIFLSNHEIEVLSQKNLYYSYGMYIY